MRHHNVVRKFGRESNERRAFLRSLAKNFIEKGKIKTTEARAKELRSYVEKLITIGRTGDLASRRLIASKIGGGNNYVKKLVDEISPKYAKRTGGYTRIIKLGRRLGDGSKMALLELVS